MKLTINKYPGWRHMTASQRHNARMEKIWEDARKLERQRIANGETPNPNLTSSKGFMQANLPRQPDITTSHCGSIMLLIGATKTGLAWLRENLGSESWQWNGPSIAVEPRLAADILAAAEDDDLEVEV